MLDLKHRSFFPIVLFIEIVVTGGMLMYLFIVTQQVIVCVPMSHGQKHFLEQREELIVHLHGSHVEIIKYVDKS